MELYNAYGFRIGSVTDPGGLTKTQWAKRAINAVCADVTVDADVTVSNLLQLIDYTFDLLRQLREPVKELGEL